MAASRSIASAYSIVAAASDANVRSVEFSYAQLRNTFMSISNFLSEYYSAENLQYRGCPIVYNIDSAGIDTRAIRVEVALLDTSPGQLELFRENVVDHPALAFVQLADGVSMTNRNPYAAPTTTVSASLFQNPLQGHIVTRISQGRHVAEQRVNDGVSHHPLVSTGEIVRAERVVPFETGPVLVFGTNFIGNRGDSCGIVVHWSGGEWQVAGIVIGGVINCIYCIANFKHSVRINRALDIELR